MDVYAPPTVEKGDSFLVGKSSFVVRKAAKKFFFCGMATKRGRGVRALPLRKKNFF